MGHAESKAARITPTASPEVAQNGIPQRFIVTYKKSWTKLSLLISEPDSEPSYVINLAHGAHGDMVLFNGPTMDDAPLANVKYTGKWGADFKIMLPEMEGRPHHEEILRYKANLKTERYWFAMEVGNGPNLHVEKFEWRRSHSAEVKSLGRSKWGWKLVRLGSDTAEPDVPAEESEDRADGLTSDGKEVVAIWAGAKSTHWMTVGEFEFRNSGATGEFGRLWALMAMLTRICIWQKEYQAAQTAGTVVAVT